MPPDTSSDPNNPILSRELYDLILSRAAIPVLLLLLWLSWLILSRLMNPEWQQQRRNRQIRKAVEARKELMATIEREKAEHNDS